VRSGYRDRPSGWQDISAKSKKRQVSLGKDQGPAPSKICRQPTALDQFVFDHLSLLLFVLFFCLRRFTESTRENYNPKHENGH